MRTAAAHSFHPARFAPLKAKAAASFRAPRETQAEWLTPRLRNAPLFETPGEGDAQLTPLRSTKTLKDASELFANGMWERIDWFVDGQEACFLWAGPTKAAITLRTDPMFGWSIREIVGVGGVELPFALEAEIVERFAEAGFRRRARTYPL